MIGVHQKQPITTAPILVRKLVPCVRMASMTLDHSAALFSIVVGIAVMVPACGK